MSLEDRTAALRREVERKRQEIARAERYIESIEAMPDLDELVGGSVVAMGQWPGEITVTIEPGNTMEEQA